MRCRCILMLLCAASALGAQAIDRAASGFLTDSQGRPGTCAPYRLQFEAREGSTASVEVTWRNVVFSQEVAVSKSPARLIVPVPVAAGVQVRVSVDDVHDSFSPEPPSRAVSASYGQPYAAVFATDPVTARQVLPPEPGVFAADFYDIADLFTDWRLLDGYDAVVLINSDESRLPAGAQRAVAEFCSLGGVVFVAGSFRLGDRDDLPAPSASRPLTLHGMSLQRFEYGFGAIYRSDHDLLRDAARAKPTAIDAVRNHMWFGASEPPAGPAPTRAPPADKPWLVRGPRAQGRPGPLFWVLAGALLAVAGIAPVLAERLSRRAWVGGALVAILALGIGALAVTQSGPLPVADAWALCNSGPRPDGPVSSRSFVLTDPGIVWQVDLADREQRWLPRPLGDGWVVDSPLCPAPEVHSRQSELASGRVDGINFRDFTIAARAGELHYSIESAAVVDWWLENNAWRGRAAALASATVPDQPFPPGTELRTRQGIVVTPRRTGGN